MSGIVGDAITDRMKYGIKPSAVRSDNLLHYYKADNGSSFNMQLGQDIIFQVPSIGGGYYIDWSTSYFRVQVQIDLGTTALDDGYVRFERGPESMFRRVQFQDASGGLLENFENYNDLYCLQELCTNSANNRSGPNLFHGEGFQYPHNYDVINARVVDKPVLTTAGTNMELPAMNIPSLGSVIVARSTAHGTGGTTGVAAHTSMVPLKIGAWDLYKVTGDDEYPSAIQHRKGAKYYTFQLSSAMFGGSAEKYLPMSAINGMRIVLGLENTKGAFVINGLDTLLHPINFNTMTVTLYDPTMFLNLISVDPTTDAALMNSAVGNDNQIRIHTQTWSSFYQYIPENTTTYNWNIPIKVSSLKSIYFVLAPTTYTGLENFTYNEQFWYDLNDDPVLGLPNPGVNMRTKWATNNLKTYQFFIHGVPNPTVPTEVRTGHSECIAELSRALHFGHKSSDGSYLTLLGGDGLGSYPTINAVFGQEFETFSNKSNVIESGMNTLTTDIALNLTFYDTGCSLPVYLKVFCLYDCFLTIDKTTGIMKTEV